MTRNIQKQEEDKTKKAITILRLPFSTINRNSVRRKAIVASICVLIIVAFGAITENLGSSKTAAHASDVKGFGAGIYWDQACTNRTLAFEWGSIGAGSNSNFTVYIKNEGTSAASLCLETMSWSPSVSSEYIFLAWNYSGQVLKVGEELPIELTLTVAPTISGITTFGFNSLVTAESERQEGRR